MAGYVHIPQLAEGFRYLQYGCLKGDIQTTVSGEIFSAEEERDWCEWMNLEEIVSNPGIII